MIDGPVINLNYNFYGPLKTVSYICRSYSRPLSDETRTTRVDLYPLLYASFYSKLEDSTVHFIDIKYDTNTILKKRKKEIESSTFPIHFYILYI